MSSDFPGNVTSDATNSLQSSYNLINLPSQIKSGSTVKANYTYLSDGTKAAAYTSASAGKDYVGSFTYTRGSDGSKTLESVAFGTRHPNGLTQLSANRWRFSGKEEQDAIGIAYSDFGARLYDRSAAWTAIDPLAEKYYAVSPYVYCNNRMNRSAREKTEKYKDPVKDKEWTPAENDREAFIQEAERIYNDHGVKNPNNYNLINSPGEKYRRNH